LSRLVSDFAEHFDGEPQETLATATPGGKSTEAPLCFMLQRDIGMLRIIYVE
jgi:hypothetical protein